MRVLTDYKNMRTWRMHSPNSTFPQGMCHSSPLDPDSNMVALDGKQLASSARFLGFLKQNGDLPNFVPPASGFQELVRCG